MSEDESATCLAEGCDKVATMMCPKCSKLGITSIFCSQEHFQQAWPTHKSVHVAPKPALPNVASTEADIDQAVETLQKIRDLAQSAAAAQCPPLTPESQAKCERKLRGTPGTSQPNWFTGNFRDLLTPNTMMRFETPRLVVRSVQPSDARWIYSVKGDARVNKYQLYGQPTGPTDAMTFGNGYIRDRIPLVHGLRGGGVVERVRYVLAITPKASAIPTPATNAIPRVGRLPRCPPLPHEDDTYIGNIAFEIQPIRDVINGWADSFQGPEAIRIPGDKVFEWPDVESEGARQELDHWSAQLFYEIAPQYWRQGLMSEAILSIADFVFFELGLGHLVLDPQVANAGSIALARKLPGMEYASTITCRVDFSIKQHVFVLSRADYIKRFGAPHDSMRPAGKKCCAWCCNPRALVREEGETCPQCSKRWYCGLECRAADWEAKDGHGVRCAK